MASRLRVFLRFLKATWVLTPIALAHLRDRRRFLLFGKPRRVGLEKKRERAERLAEIFENMGVTYIKLAQFMTTRPDLVPPIYIDAMERLQDDVPPEDYEDIEPVIREEIGDPKEIFDWFEEESVSGASIAQVHMASYRGEKVAVKVRRPGLEETIDADLRVLSFFVPMIIWGLKFLDQNTHAESVKGITDELKKTIREEIDLKREGDVMSEVRQHLEEDGLTDDVVVPHVYHDLTTERILTMSYEDGIKVKYDEELRRRGHDLERIVDAIADAYLNMAFRYDVFHADPHQGNLAVNDKGQAVIYDFGIAQRPPEHIREAFTHFFIGVGLRDTDVVIDALQEMGALEQGMDRETLKQVADTMIMDISGEDISSEHIDQIESQVEETLHEYPMKFPQEIILAMRTTFGIEGLCAKMAPDYDFADKLHDFFIEEQEMVNIGEMNGGNSRVLKSIERVDRFLGRTSVLKMMPVGPFLLDPDEKRPITEFLFQNKDLIERTGLVDIEFDPSVSGGGNVRMNGALSNGHTDEKVDMFDSDDLKEHMEEEMKKSSKRTTLSVLGGTFLLGSMFFFTTGTGFALPSFLVGLGCFALVRRSFKDNDRILGPKYVATRHRMEQWDEEDGGGSEEENGDFEEEFDGSEVGEPEPDLDMSRGSGWNENGDEDETMALPEPDEETGYDETSWQKPDDSFESASEKTGYGNGDDPEREEIGFENVGYSEGSEKESRRRL